MAEFNTSVLDKGEISVINLKGYLDAHTAPKLENNFTQLIDQKRFNIVVNFEELAYISSAGLGVFMAYIEKIRENHGDIKQKTLFGKARTSGIHNDSFGCCVCCYQFYGHISLGSGCYGELRKGP